jgi:hypothetical protein
MKVSTKSTLTGITAALVAALPLSAPASKLSWFDDAPFAGVGSVGVPEVRLRDPKEYKSFGLDLYRPRSIAAEEGYPLDSGESSLGSDTVRLYGQVESSRTPSLSVPESRVSRPVPFEDPSLNRVNVFGVKWQHRMDAINSFAVSAEYGEGVAVYPTKLDTLDTRAAFTWTSQFSGGIKPNLTSSVFLGDETAREEIYRHLGRKYYGFAVGGSLTLFQAHTPYVSFKMQKSLYESAEDTLLVSPRSDDRSLLSAGWKWQVQRSLSLQAEASYGLGNTANPELYNPERSRIFFGTRYGFK